MGTPISGTDGRFQINGINLNVEEFEAEETTTDTDTTSFEDAGYETGVTSTRVLEVTGRGYWDAGQNPHSNPPNLVPSQNATSVVLFVSKSLNYRVTCATMRVLRIKITGRVKGRIDFEFSMKSQGAFFLPGVIAG